jgi:signal transduction histidine kinase
MIAALAEKLGLNISTDNFLIRAEQMRILVKAYPSMIVANIVMSPLVALLMWNKIDHAVLVCWVGLLYCFHILEIRHWLNYPKKIENIKECRRWQKQFLLSDSLVGVLWGSAGVFMFIPGEPIFQAFVLCIMMGMAAGAVAGNLVFPMSQQTYVALVILPITINMLLQGTREYYLLATMVGVFLVFVMKAGRDQSEFFELSIRRGFEHTELLEKLEKQNEQMVRASELKSKFLAAVSHDLRQPLYALNLFFDALKPYVKEDGQKVQDQIRRSTLVLNSMFDSLLDITRLEAGVIVINSIPSEMNPVLDTIRHEFEWLANQKNLKLIIHECAHIVCTDTELLKTILRNLVSNAIRYTEQGEIRIHCYQENDQLRLEVSDTGIGIEQEYLPKIFDEYFQVSQTNPRSEKGLGLGLSIVKQLEKLLGYKLQVSSAVGKGTKFELFIPILVM